MSTLSLGTQGMEQMKCILFSDSAVCLPPLSTGGLKLSTARLNYHKFRLSSGCSQTCFSLWHSVSGPSARDPCQPTSISAGFKYTRKELVGLVLCHLLHQRAFGTASIPFHVDSSPAKSNEWVALNEGWEISIESNYPSLLLALLRHFCALHFEVYASMPIEMLTVTLQTQPPQEN